MAFLMPFLKGKGYFFTFLQLFEAMQPAHSPQHALPFFRLLMMPANARARTAASITRTMMSPVLISSSETYYQNSIAIRWTITAPSHAMKHCQRTTEIAHLCPSSRRMDAMAATQGV